MEFRRPVEISTHAFAFCRYTLTVLLWLALILQMKALVVVVWAVLVVSAIVGIQRAPLIVLYTRTLGKRFPSGTTELDVTGMRIAQSMGAVLGFLCLLFLYFLNARVGWILTAIYAVIKTFSAIKACPVYKLYVCMTSGSCCTFLRRNG